MYVTLEMHVIYLIDVIMMDMICLYITLITHYIDVKEVVLYIMYTI